MYGPQYVGRWTLKQKERRKQKIINQCKQCDATNLDHNSMFHFACK